MAFLTTILNGVQSLLGLVLPFMAQARAWSGWRRTIYWVLHVVVVAVISAVLVYIDSKTGTYGTAAHWPYPLYFLAIFVLIYAIGWILWWIWKLLGLEEPSRYPDIDTAWDEAVRALNDRRIHLGDLPLFLVLGKLVGESEETLFEAAGWPLKLKRTPESSDAPLHVYAYKDESERDSIFVSCSSPSLSLLARKANQLAESGDGAINLSDSALVRGGGTLGMSILRTLAGGRNALRRLLGQGPRGMDVEPAEVKARLEHLCRLIARDREGLISVNGILVLIPFAALDKEQHATEIARDCRSDLTVAREALCVRCPCFALVCDAEEVPGFSELVEKLPDDRRKRRQGSGFPLVPACDPGKVPEKVAELVHWYCRSFVPSWIYRDHFVVENPGTVSLEEATTRNSKLYQLMYRLHDGEKNLSTVIQDVIANADDVPFWFGGFYVAGTGGKSQQAFVQGVFDKVLKLESSVSWTDDALRNDAWYRRWTSIGYGAIIVLVFAICGGIYWMTRR
jgi:hypothetical protein